MISFIKLKVKKYFFASNSKQEYLKKLISRGLIVGENFSIQEGCIIDSDHCWHIKIGNNVTFAPRVHILAHDASSYTITGYTKVKKVTIGNNVFIGASCIVLPGVTITDNVIIGAGTVVFKSISEPGVYVGSELRKVCTYEEYENKLKIQLNNSSIFDESYTLRNPEITSEMKEQMNNAIEQSTTIFVR